MRRRIKHCCYCGHCQHFSSISGPLMFGKETLRFKDVVQDIISHVKMNKSSGVDVKSEGLLAKGPTEQRGRSKEEEKDSGRSSSTSRGAVECYYCKKNGHIKNHYRK